MMMKVNSSNNLVEESKEHIQMKKYFSTTNQDESIENTSNVSDNLYDSQMNQSEDRNPVGGFSLMFQQQKVIEKISEELKEDNNSGENTPKFKHRVATAVFGTQ
jgi:hypothetical protein